MTTTAIPGGHSWYGITYLAPCGDTITICDACDAELTGTKHWPRDVRGQEFCQVSRGRHWIGENACEIRHGYFGDR